MTNNQPFVLERTLDAPVSKVWSAITDITEMRKWYFDLDGFEPTIGFEFTFRGCGAEGEEYLHLCKVLEVVPGTKISYSWRYDNKPGNSVVTFELAAQGDTTTLRLTHTGLETFDTENPDFAPSSFASGWTEIIGKSLPDYLAETARM